MEKVVLASTIEEAVRFVQAGAKVALFADLYYDDLPPPHYYAFMYAVVDNQETANRLLSMGWGRAQPQEGMSVMGMSRSMADAKPLWELSEAEKAGLYAKVKEVGQDVLGRLKRDLS